MLKALKSRFSKKALLDASNALDDYLRLCQNKSESNTSYAKQIRRIYDLLTRTSSKYFKVKVINKFINSISNEITYKLITIEVS